LSATCANKNVPDVLVRPTDRAVLPANLRSFSRTSRLRSARLSCASRCSRPKKRPGRQTDHLRSAGGNRQGNSLQARHRRRFCRPGQILFRGRKQGRRGELGWVTQNARRDPKRLWMPSPGCNPASTRCDRDRRRLLLHRPGRRSEKIGHDAAGKCARPDRADRDQRGEPGPAAAVVDSLRAKAFIKMFL